MNKKTLAIILALVLLAAALVAVYFVTRPETTEGMKTFTLVVDHKDSTKTLEVKTDKAYVGEALQEKGIIKGEEGPYGLYIQEVDGEQAIFEVDGAYWAFYVGEEYATQGIDLTPIEDGKTYKLAYTIDNQ